MNFYTKRRCSFVVIFLYTFFNGVEYAVVFPTLWEYLQSLGVPPSNVYLLGACISAVTVTDMIASLVVGRLLDCFTRVSWFILTLNLFQIVSGLIYGFASSSTWILLSRLIAGVGNVASVALMTDVTRATSKEERTSVLVSFSIAQQVGLLFGPACNLFLRQISFTLFGFEVNKLNGPGFFLATMYFIFEFVVLLMYYDLAKEYAKEQKRIADESNPQILEINFTPVDETPIQILDPNISWAEYKNELFRGEIVALIFLRFIGLFGQTCLEAVLTPMMMTFFNYSDFENSILYLLGGLELLVVSILMAIISKKVSDRSFIAFGIFISIATYVWMLIFIPRFQPGDRSNLVLFGVGFILDLIGIPILLDIALSLLTKLVRDEVQGLATGIRRFCSNIALLLGPLWGSGALPYLNTLFILPLALLIVAAIMFAHSYRSLFVRPIVATSPDNNQSEGEEIPSERTPLIQA